MPLPSANHPLSFVLCDVPMYLDHVNHNTLDLSKRSALATLTEDGGNGQ